MKALVSGIAALVNFVFACAAGLVVMVYGWGLEAKSWPVIIGGYLAVALSTALVALLNSWMAD